MESENAGTMSLDVSRPTPLLEKLIKQKEALQLKLAEVQAAIVILEANPSFVSIIDTLAKVTRISSCWQFSWKERIKVLFGAKLFWSQMTFKQPLQPVQPTIANSFKELIS